MGISYDFNHVTGTHNTYFNINQAELVKLAWNNLDSVSQVRIGVEHKTLIQKLLKPQFLFVPEAFDQKVTHFFPSMFIVEVSTKSGTTWQIFYYYPVSDKQSIAGSVVFATYPKFVTDFMKSQAIYSGDLIVQQDMVETERQVDVVPAFKLPNDEIIERALTMYTMYSDEQLTLEDVWVRKY